VTARSAGQAIPVPPVFFDFLLREPLLLLEEALPTVVLVLDLAGVFDFGGVPSFLAKSFFRASSASAPNFRIARNAAAIAAATVAISFHFRHHRVHQEPTSVRDPSRDQRCWVHGARSDHGVLALLDPPSFHGVVDQVVLGTFRHTSREEAASIGPTVTPDQPRELLCCTVQGGVRRIFWAGTSTLYRLPNVRFGVGFGRRPSPEKFTHWLFILTRRYWCWSCHAAVVILLFDHRVVEQHRRI
jgi:hypothetical protein